MRPFEKLEEFQKIPHSAQNFYVGRQRSDRGPSLHPDRPGFVTQ